MKQRETLVIQSDPNNINMVDDWAERIADEMGFSSDERDDIAICVTEAVNNAIIHGNGQDPSKRVIIEFIKKKNELRVKVRDEGGGFDPSEVDDPTKPENLLKPCGRGIHIIRKLMDDVWIDCLKEGCQTTLVKRRRRR